MGATTLTDLLTLPGPEQHELAMALWQSLDTPEQERALEIDAELSSGLERRLARHQQHPEEAGSWAQWDA
jgi:putative addiction module component (TIGR02574 family)